MSKPFNSAIITTAGAALLARVEAGQISMEVTKIVIGDGTYSASERKASALRERTSLKSERNTYFPSAVSVISEDTIKITALFSNYDDVSQTVLVSRGYFVNELAVYCKENGGAASTEVLYCIAVTSGDTGDYMPPYVGGGASQIIQDVYLTVGNAATAYVDLAGAAFLATEGQALKSEVASIKTRVESNTSAITALDTRVNGLIGSATPTPVATVAQMTDTSIIYVYTGSETGYTPGDWYYYDSSSSSWKSGGEYGAALIDSTLSRKGQAADAKAVGDKIEGIKDDVSKAVVPVEEWEPVTLTLQNGYYTQTGIFYEAYDKSSAKIAVTEGARYRLSTYIRSTLISGIIFFDANDAVLSTLLDGLGTGTIITDYDYIVPQNAVSMAVQSGDKSLAVPVLSAYKKTSSFIGYTKTEINEKLDAVPKKYGIKWEIANPDDLGQRCFDSIGLTAMIGVGSTNGQSDFDSIYPWSEIRRCNIRVNANGAKIVTYEGETGFSLDGTNGDVFVRIPKFYYERYRINGYEYRIISSRGVAPHPAFIENGKEIDEIFIGAFEGYISNNILQSKAAIIPTSNETAQTFLTSAQNKGIGYTLYDMRCVDAIWTLMAVEYGCRNTNQIIGYGFANFLQPVTGANGVDYDGEPVTTNIFSASVSIPTTIINSLVVGTNVNICKGNQLNVVATRKLVSKSSDSSHHYFLFDGDPIALDTTCFIGSAACTTNFCETVPSGALLWHTGRADWITGSNTKNPIRYRWIENIVGSLWAFLPDITFNDLQMYFCKDITKYEIGSITNGYNPVGDLFTEQTSNGSKADVANSNYWITDLSELSFGKGVDFGKAWDTSLVSTKAFGAFYYLSSGLISIIANGGGFDHLYRCNMLTNRAWIKITDKWYLYGARLIYKEIN